MTLSAEESINVLGEPLEACSMEPLTGFFRDGHCNTCSADQGSHTVCAVMNEEFLAYSAYVGNDLSTPAPQYAFPGLKPGDHWCVCARRFLQAHDEGCAPYVNLRATHRRALDVIPLEVLQRYDTGRVRPR